MNSRAIKWCLGSFLGAVLASSSVYAQMFGDDTDVPAKAPAWGTQKAAPRPAAPQATEQPKKELQIWKARSDNESNSYKNLKAPEKEQVENPEDYLYKDTPQIDRPTLDGVQRGRSEVKYVNEQGDLENGDGYILLYYSDFSIGNMMNGSVSCNVKFQILSTLDRKLNALAVRLKWPGLETPLNYIDVRPNQQYHFYYTLLGDGCYSMDKVPNIVINRCRVKGMSQEDCAKRVRWIRKS